MTAPPRHPNRAPLHQTQELADAAALAAGVMIPCSGQNAYAAVDALVSRQLDASTLLSQARSPCGSSSSSWTRTYPDGTRVTATYPYRDDSHFEVEVVSPEVPLLLGAVLKAVPTRLTARAVSQNGGVTTALNYALYAENGIDCAGSYTTNVYGSIYSGALISNCSIYAHASLDGSDSGTIVVYPPNQQWSQGGGYCLPGRAISNVLCADSYEMSSNQCAPGSTQFLAGSGSCPSWSPSAPDLTQFAPPEPNTDASVLATIGGTACDPNGTASTYTPLKIKSNVIGRMARQTGTNKPSVDSAGYYHFYPGCYGWLDVSLVQKADKSAGSVVVFEPGFYYFSGYYDASADGQGGQGPGTAGGLCLGGGTQLVGRDVVFEFTSRSGAATGLSTSTCDLSPTSSTSSKLGADPLLPLSDAGTSYSYLSAPCDVSANPRCPLPSGYRSWCPTTDRACNALLVWAPPGPPVSSVPVINGTFYAKGASQWLYGTVYWPGACQWTANGTTTLVGQLVCASAALQGGASTPGYNGILYSRGDHVTVPSQSGLSE